MGGYYLLGTIPCIVLVKWMMAWLSIGLPVRLLLEMSVQLASNQRLFQYIFPYCGQKISPEKPSSGSRVFDDTLCMSCCHSVPSIHLSCPFPDDQNTWPPVVPTASFHTSSKSTPDSSNSSLIFLAAAACFSSPKPPGCVASYCTTSTQR